MQYSYFPWTKAPEESTSVAHQGESPSMVVQVVCFRPAKVNGKTQFPHVPDPDPEEMGWSSAVSESSLARLTVSA